MVPLRVAMSLLDRGATPGSATVSLYGPGGGILDGRTQWTEEEWPKGILLETCRAVVGGAVVTLRMEHQGAAVAVLLRLDSC